MGYYIETGANHGKAEWLISNHAAKEIDLAEWSQRDPQTDGLVVVVDNGLFEAAGVAHNASEQAYWIGSAVADVRPRRYLVMDRATSRKLANIVGINT